MTVIQTDEGNTVVDVDDGPVVVDGPGDDRRRFLSTAELAARAERARQRLRALILDDRTNAHIIPLVLLGVVVAYWLRVFIPLTVDHYRYFGFMDFDVAIFDQSSWLLANGRGFITVRGLPFFGHHLNLGLALFAPLYRLGLGGPAFLNAAQVVALAATVIPITAICRRYRPAESWTALGLSAAFLFNPVPQHLIAESFHPDVMAVPFLFAALWAALDRRWRLFALFAVLTVCWKEDLALVIIMLGLGIAVKRDRKVGALTVGIAAGYFLLATRVIIPHFTGGDTFYAGFLGPLGSTPGEVTSNFISHPELFTDKYNQNDGFGYFTDLQSSWAFASLLSPASLVLALPTYLINVLSSQGYTQEVLRHYATVPFAVSAFSAIRGVQSRARALSRAGLVVAILFVTLWSRGGGTGPWSAHHRSGLWRLDASDRHESLERAIAVLPPDASVTASHTVLTHISQRPEAYLFPNPFLTEYWGILDRDPRSPDRVDWIIIDLPILSSPEHVVLTGELRASDCFETVLEDSNVLVLHRTSKDCGTR